VLLSGPTWSFTPANQFGTVRVYVLSLTHTVVVFFTHNVLLIAHTSRGHIAHTYRGHVDHVCTTVTLLVHTGVTLSVMPAADRGIHVQEADKQKPSVLELLAHFRSCVAAKAKLFPGEGQKQLLERVIKEYNSLMKVFPRWKLSTVLL
jgi:hypothetical protein